LYWYLNACFFNFTPGFENAQANHKFMLEFFCAINKQFALNFLGGVLSSILQSSLTPEEKASIITPSTTFSFLDPLDRYILRTILPPDPSFVAPLSFTLNTVAGGLSLVGVDSSSVQTSIIRRTPSFSVLGGSQNITSPALSVPTPSAQLNPPPLPLSTKPTKESSQKVTLSFPPQLRLNKITASVNLSAKIPSDTTPQPTQPSPVVSSSHPSPMLAVTNTNRLSTSKLNPVQLSSSAVPPPLPPPPFPTLNDLPPLPDLPDLPPLPGTLPLPNPPLATIPLPPGSMVIPPPPSGANSSTQGGTAPPPPLPATPKPPPLRGPKPTSSSPSSPSTPIPPSSNLSSNLSVSSPNAPPIPPQSVVLLPPPPVASKSSTRSLFRPSSNVGFEKNITCYLPLACFPGEFLQVGIFLFLLLIYFFFFL
jgi:hypothetical protein